MVVSLDEANLAVRARPADAVEVDELVALDGFPTAVVLPATYLHDDVHDIKLDPAGWPYRTPGRTGVALRAALLPRVRHPRSRLSVSARGSNSPEEQLKLTPTELST